MARSGVRTMVVGGCAYRYQIDSRVAASILALSQLLPLGMLCGINYRHTSNLWQGRYLWLEAQMLSGVDYALSIDADTNFDAVMMRNAIEYADKHVGPALRIAPVRQGDGQSNLRDLQFQNLNDSEHAIAQVQSREIGWGGMAVALFDLNVLREIWKDQVVPSTPPYLRVDTPGMVVPARKEGWIGEDTGICIDIRARGGSIWSLPVRTTHYLAVQ